MPREPAEPLLGDCPPRPYASALKVPPHPSSEVGVLHYAQVLRGQAIDPLEAGASYDLLVLVPSPVIFNATEKDEVVESQSCDIGVVVITIYGRLI
ncbi:hypothetical protein JCM5296_001213 [Sporobolomyces johnsonii]